MQSLRELIELSNRYGKNPEYVLAGGGNTSVKIGNALYVKGSGTALATIDAAGFVEMDRRKLAAMMEKEYSSEDKLREEQALCDLLDARVIKDEKRPSVETLLHNLFNYKFVLHIHPALVNGLTCSRDGKSVARELFPNSVWVDACRPGYVLAMRCRDACREDTKLLFLQNHGVFFAADTVSEIDKAVSEVMEKIHFRLDCVREISELSESTRFVKYVCPGDNIPSEPLTPDHIVYCKAFPLFTEKATLKKDYEEYLKKYRYCPRIFVLKNAGVYAACESRKAADTAKLLFSDAVRVAEYARSFGGISVMSGELTDFIVNWEAESYRAKKDR